MCVCINIKINMAIKKFKKIIFDVRHLPFSINIHHTIHNEVVICCTFLYVKSLKSMQTTGGKVYHQHNYV